jgi:hypothetical protein
MQASPNRDKMSVDAWVRAQRHTGYCCVWCIKDKLIGRLQSKHYSGAKNSKKKTLRTFRVSARKFWTYYTVNEIDFWPDAAYNVATTWQGRNV